MIADVRDDVDLTHMHICPKCGDYWVCNCYEAEDTMRRVCPLCETEPMR